MAKCKAERYRTHWELCQLANHRLEGMICMKLIAIDRLMYVHGISNEVIAFLVECETIVMYQNMGQFPFQNLATQAILAENL